MISLIHLEYKMDRSITSASFLFLSYLIAWILFSYSEKILVDAFPYFMKALKTEEEYWTRPAIFFWLSDITSSCYVFSVELLFDLWAKV